MRYYCPTRFEVPFSFQTSTRCFGMGWQAGERLGHVINKTTLSTHEPIVVFGCAGALDPHLKPGDIVVIRDVVCDSQTFRLLPRDGLRSVRAYSAPTILKTRGQKTQARQDHDCEIVEMEFGGLLSTLEPNHWDRLILVRGILDSADQALVSPADWLTTIRHLGIYHREMATFLSQLRPSIADN